MFSFFHFQEDAESESEEDEDVGGSGIEEFEGCGQITNFVKDMPDGIVDDVYVFNQREFASQTLFLHDRVKFKARKNPGSVDWRITEMKLDKEPKVEEMEARLKFALTRRKVKSANQKVIELEPLVTLQGTAVERITNTLQEVKLIPGKGIIHGTFEIHSQSQLSQLKSSSA